MIFHIHNGSNRHSFNVNHLIKTELFVATFSDKEKEVFLISLIEGKEIRVIGDSARIAEKQYLEQSKKLAA